MSTELEALKAELQKLKEQKYKESKELYKKLNEQDAKYKAIIKQKDELIKVSFARIEELMKYQYIAGLILQVRQAIVSL